MKLNVSGIETIEVTDPKGLCNQPVPQVGQPAPWQPAPTPYAPQPAGAPWITPMPYTGAPLPLHTEIWSKTLPRSVVPRFDPDYNEKWERGISKAQTAEPQKWAENWQSKMSQSPPEGQNEVEG